MDDYKDTNLVADSDNLKDELKRHLQDPTVIKFLIEKAKIFWERDFSYWGNWLKEKYHSTLASILFTTITRLCPDLNTDDLIVDIDSGPVNEEDIEKSKNIRISSSYEFKNWP